MSFLALLPFVGKILSPILGIIDKAVPDKDLATRLKAQVQLEMTAMDFSSLEKEIDAKAKILVAEIQGKSWIQRTWRPILMLTIVAIVANNYIIFPYLSMFTDKVVILDLPDKLYNLMSIGVGGYIVGRSGEKIVTKWKESKGE